jgi:hypothetical protein
MRTAFVQASDTEVSVVLRGLNPDELRRRALGECGRVFGDCPFRLTQAEVVPCIRTAGGQVRLYECRVCACRTN